MKKVVYRTSFIFMILFAFSFIGESFSSEVAFVEHSAVGKIISTDFDSDKPTITIQYTYTDVKFVKNEEREIKLRIEDTTKIADESGKELKKEDLKIGDEVSATFKTKWNFDQKPLWRIALTITAKSATPPEVPEENIPEKRLPDEEKEGLYY
ncbi:MAG: hypothetical protein AB1629_08035 [Candidatus Omnitrophota bacterium]